MKWTNEQEYALEKMRNGCNVFITGEAGTGKSEVVKAFIKEAEENGKNVLITAPTGIAADNLNGETLHRTFNAEIGVISNRKRPKSRNDLLEITDVIVIDEISMCRIDLFEYVANLILAENDFRQREAFLQTTDRTDPIQLIVLGDFLQLPPVVTDDDKELLYKFYGDVGKGFAFQSVLWDALDFSYINLKEIVRQEDTAFKNVLSKIRIGENKRACADFLMRQSSPIPFDNESSVYLCGRNARVADVNEKCLAALPGAIEEYESDVYGDIKASDKFAEDILTLKPGCKVIMTVNDPERRFKNGSMGKYVGSDIFCLKVKIISTGEIVSVTRFGKEVTKPVPVEKEKKVTYFDDAGNKQVKTEVVTEIDHEVVGTFVQYPMRLAYAITIHKSQGQTFDYANIDPYCWDDGQFYTAVSRGKRLENICFTGSIRDSYIKTSRAVLKKFANLLK